MFLKERLLIADMALAGCEFMFEETRNYVKQRKAFGKTIAHLQVSLNCKTCKARCTMEFVYIHMCNVEQMKVTGLLPKDCLQRPHSWAVADFFMPNVFKNH